MSSLNLDIRSGEFIVLLGPSGAGKTTTLRLVAGLQTPDAGCVSIGGRDVTALAPALRDVTFVFQQYSSYPHLTVFENLAFPLRSPMRPTSQAEIDHKVNEVARMLRIEDSRFDLYFPRLEDGALSATAEASAPPLAQGHGEHVLCIDDDEVMLLMVEQLLLNLGYRATCLADPFEALAAVRAGPGRFDIVVTDFNMPQMSGLDLARALREVDAGLPVVISSGYIPEQLRSEARAAGVVALMRKEHTLDDLGSVIERALAAQGSEGGTLSG